MPASTIEFRAFCTQINVTKNLERVSAQIAFSTVGTLTPSSLHSSNKSLAACRLFSRLILIAIDIGVSIEVQLYRAIKELFIGADTAKYM